MDPAELKPLIAEVRAELALDPRSAVFEIEPIGRDRAVVLTGRTTEPAAVERLAALIPSLGADRVVDEVVRLPDPALGKLRFALVRAAIAPVQAAPSVSATQVSQLVLGHRVDLLAEHELWYRVRCEDGYIGWVHQGYLERCDEAWAGGWERGDVGEPVVCLGVELADEEGRSFARPPWGARLMRVGPHRLQLPDGRRGTLAEGEIVDVDRLADRFPARGESVIRTARRWLGTPYIWGGVTPAGADCSGFVQSVLRLHGIRMPRDSDLQARTGEPVTPGTDSIELRPGDLLFFAEKPGRITHVAFSLGGPHILHSALSNGGVDVNDLAGDLELETRLKGYLVARTRFDYLLSSRRRMGGPMSVGDESK